MLKKTLLLGSSVMLAAAISAPANAQLEEDEIIVTATKRSQTLQETPVAVSVTPADVIEKANILDIKDLQAVVPTLRVTQLQSSQNTNFIIRGFGNGANNAGIEPAVGVFIDGVYRSRAAAQIGDLPKLERVEVLSGPQSTLYGKNSSAGVISIVTAKPSFDGNAYAQVGYGNYNAVSLKGYMTDGDNDGNFAVSFGGSYNVRDGYATSLSGQPDLNDRDRWNIRAQALWAPSDDFELRIIGDVSEVNEQCCMIGLVDAVTGLRPSGSGFDGIGVVGALTAPAPFGLGATITSPFDYAAAFNAPSSNFIDDKGLSFHADWNISDNVALTSITSFRNNDGGYDTEIDYTGAEISNSVRIANDIDTFTQEIRLASVGDNTIDWLLGGFYFDESIDSTSSLEYSSQFRAYGEILTAGLGAPGVLGQIEQANGLAPGTFFAAGPATAEEFTQDNKAWSVFGQLDFDVSDRLTLTFGGNYTDDQKDVSMRQIFNNDTFAAIDLAGAEGINTLAAGGFVANFPAFSQSCIDPNTMMPFANPLPFSPTNIGVVSMTQCFVPGTGFIPGNLAFAGFQQQVVAGATALAQSPNNPLLGLQAFQFLPPLTGFSDSSSDDKFTYTLRAAFEVSDNINIYGSYATGFKATSWNLSRDTRPVVAPAGANVNEGTGTRLAGPEEASVIEFGLKARFDKGAFNLAVFDQKVKGFQSNLFRGTGFVLSNAGEQSSRGFEWSGVYRPVDNLALNLSGTYLDAKYDSFVGAPGPFDTVIDRSGQKVDGVHPWSIIGGFQYDHDFSNGATGYLRGSVLYESPTQIVSNVASIAQLESQGFVIANTLNGLATTEREVMTVDASAGVTFDNGVGVQIWAKNLFNDEYLMSAFPGVAQPGTFYGYPNPPRTYGFVLRKDF